MTVGGVAREIYEHLGGILKGLGEDKKEHWRLRRG